MEYIKSYKIFESITINDDDLYLIKDIFITEVADELDITEVSREKYHNDYLGSRNFQNIFFIENINNYYANNTTSDIIPFIRIVIMTTSKSISLKSLDSFKERIERIGFKYDIPSIFNEDGYTELYLIIKK